MTGITFLVIFLLLMILMAVIPQILQRFHIPTIVSMMLIGIAIGPNALDLIRVLNHMLGRGYPTEQIYVVLEAMGLLGLLFLMVLAGMEVNLRILLSEKKAVIWLSVLTFALPALAGYMVYGFFEPGDKLGKWVYASLFASHSVGIVFPVMRELNAVRTRFGVAVLASTVITDIASLILLAICIQFKRHEIVGEVSGSISIFDHINPGLLGAWFPILFVSVIVIYILLSMRFIPIAADRILGRFHPKDDARITSFLAGVLVVVFIGELIGVSLIVGAFIAGMALTNVKAFHDDNRILHKKVESIGYGFIIPFLFLTIGMKTDLRIIFAAWESALIMSATLFCLVVSKVFSGWLAMRFSGFNNMKGICAGLMTVPQLTATLAAAAVALQLTMITPEFFNAIVFLSIATTIPVPSIVKLLIVKNNITFDSVEDCVSAAIEMPEDNLI
ncbi:MAG: cation:proton antiporter [Sedimentisphaerales bacterium]|nr:cation:proton antiporter [Sedimentisphaerales bacterium]MBN2842623.1 cation:proton antiporter [Sedimentisphaerales bacterium]